MRDLYRGIWVIGYLEVRRFVQDRARIVSSLGFPLLFLAIFGAGFNNVVGSMAGGLNLIRFMYPGIIAMAGLMTALVAGLSVVADREAGFLREILVAPLSRTGIVLGKAFGAAGVALVQVLMLLVVGPILGVRIDLGIVARLLPVVIILSLALSGLGIFIASFMKSSQGFQMMVNVLVFPMIFLAGVFFPVGTVPTWMRVLSKVNPVTYGVDAIRQIFLGTRLAASGLGVTLFGHTMTIGQEVTVVGALGAILVAGAAWAFGRQQ